MLHEELAELIALGDEHEDGFVDAAAGEIDGANQSAGVGGDVEVLLLVVRDRQDVKLPGLTAIEYAEALLVEVELFEVGDARLGDVLLDPGVFDELGIDAVEALGEVAEGAVGDLLNVEDVPDLAAGENALLDEQFADGDAFARAVQSCLLKRNDSSKGVIGWMGVEVDRVAEETVEGRGRYNPPAFW